MALWHLPPGHVPLCHVPTALGGGWTAPLALFLLAPSLLRFFATFPHRSPFRLSVYQSISHQSSVYQSLYHFLPHHTLPPPNSTSSRFVRRFHPLTSPFPPPQSVCPDPFPQTEDCLSHLAFRSILASSSSISYPTSHGSPARHHGQQPIYQVGQHD